jgi:hypothetical protein
MKPQHSSRKIIANLILVLFTVVIGAPVVILAFFGYQVYSFSRSPVSAAKLARLKPGMDTARVERLLGKPNQHEVFTNQFSGHWTQWTYSNPGSWKFVCVYFDGNGLLENHIED